MALIITEEYGVKVVVFDMPTLLDQADIDSVGEQLFDLVDSQARRKILLDFRKVRLLSSSMLGTLIQLNKKSKAIKGKVVLCGLRPDVRKVLRTTKLDKLLEIAEDEDQAMGSFRAIGSD